ncbi:histone deacetylase family protein [Gilvimarinus xylanilyticus]|uniref:Histone deacetylase family protein n=1 Tax=Gilvimarinus xylanilyticus TaxID=2944139 RepID=A0A9X2I3A6_9GAMM|nr:histone deacetylase family protein [Gilvimarinus xylanilyticus]MCP8899211.1 histone deacetylase family protein [Gilvimarinus xylanilyticus]
MSVVVISHPSCLEHLTPEGHPECPARLEAIHNQLLTSGLEFAVSERDALPATDAQLRSVHDTDYLNSLEGMPPARGVRVFGDDIWMSPHTLTAARHAAGAGAQGVDLIMAGQAQTVFCNVRPPGHHAERNHAMGFCFYNNIAIAARHALDHYHLQRVAIVDFDIHHGNGTQDIFVDEPRVLFCSSFQHPFYPGTDVTPNRRHIVNTPLKATASGPEFRAAVSEHWLPALDAFAPEMLFISAGFDGHLLDDMSSTGLVEQDYQWVTQQLRDFMDRHNACRGIVSMLEGGYELGALGRSVVAHIKALGKL